MCAWFSGETRLENPINFACKLNSRHRWFFFIFRTKVMEPCRTVFGFFEFMFQCLSSLATLVINVYTLNKSVACCLGYWFWWNSISFFGWLEAYWKMKIGFIKKKCEKWTWILTFRTEHQQTHREPQSVIVSGWIWRSVTVIYLVIFAWFQSILNVEYTNSTRVSSAR